MACLPCGKMRANMKSAAKSGNFVEAAKIAAVGVSAALHLQDKEAALAQTEQIIATLTPVEAVNVKRYEKS